MTTIFGILNITADSFSDGGRFLDPKAALAHAEKLMADGADALDVGGASSNPRSEPISPDIEIGRLAPIVLVAKERGWKISVDSFASETQTWALNEGVDYLNDIQGFSDPAMYPALAEAKAKLIVMHSVHGAGPAKSIDTDPKTIMGRIADFFEMRIDALARAGVARERMILDPGMGLFVGTRPEVSLTILRRLTQLKSVFGLPVLVSVSRKSFLRKLVGRTVDEIGPGTLAAELYAALHGADMIRTHEPKPLRDALTIWSDIVTGVS
ncbi:MAG TPA: dihydropteroate synthase [Micropepsaceae bacterium]|nr:dihydropteroate synthase [Micropepsaceae bacterium]